MTFLNDDACMMRREPRPWIGGHDSIVDSIVAAYGAAKATGDLSRADFDRVREALCAEDGPNIPIQR